MSDERPARSRERDTAEIKRSGLRRRLRNIAKLWLLGTRSRRLFLQVGLPRLAAILVGLVSVLYSAWSKKASDVFLGWVAGRLWLAFAITPVLTVVALFLPRRWFTGSEGSGIPQVIAALHARRAEEEDTLMRRLFGMRVVVAALGFATHGETWGSGYDQARHLLTGIVPVSEGYAITKWGAMIATYMVGIPGGLFSPSLSIGAGIAQWVHTAFGWAPMAAVIAVCMTGYLAAVTQSPITPEQLLPGRDSARGELFAEKAGPASGRMTRVTAAPHRPISRATSRSPPHPGAARGFPL
jgi:H+/Cl- antiporter ClcA